VVHCYCRAIFQEKPQCIRIERLKEGYEDEFISNVKEKKVRIAHIAPPWITIPPKNYGGTENVLYTLIEEQIAQGHEVTLFAPSDARTSAKQISFFARSLCECGFPWQAHMKAYYHLHKAVAYLKMHLLDFDILHTHLSSPSDMYIFPLTEALPLPHITTLHSQFPFDRTLGYLGNGDHYYMEWLAQVPLVAISENALQQEQKKFPLNFIGVVHHGIDLRPFTSPCPTPENFFVWLGRLVPDKGAHLAIEAAKQAGVSLILAGTVDPHICGAQEYFQEQIEPELDGQQIRYVGPVSALERNTLLRHARGMLNPLLWEEPFGMVMIEAMAAGCPVIAFRRGAASEIIACGQAGFLVDNVAEMIACIHKVHLLDRNLVRRHVETHFSAQIMTADYLRIYKRVIKMKKEQPMLLPFIPSLNQTVPPHKVEEVL
jgi:glycosyltransferase involved in cell wall biosynthesis